MTIALPVAGQEADASVPPDPMVPSTEVLDANNTPTGPPPQATTKPASESSASQDVHPEVTAVSSDLTEGTAGHEPKASNLDLALTPEMTDKTWGWSALPVGVFTPETQLGLGGFGVVFFRLGKPFPKARPSSVAGVGLLTTRKQAIFELITELYSDHDHNRLWSKLDYRYYPNAFWGIGPRASESQKEWYVENGPRLQLQLRRIFYEHLYLEGRIDAQFAQVQGRAPGGLLETGDVLGSHGKRVIGVGPTLGWDSRDHSLDPRTGGYYELSMMQFHRVLQSQFTFARIEVNLRHYQQLAPGHTLALQAYMELALGQVPFYRLALVGGQRLLRGYFEGRYRDHALLATQVEYRAHLFWRIGAVVFAGAGDVGPSLTEIPFSPIKWSLGGGLRFRLNEDERLNLRADFGVGHNTVGVYVGIAEAF